MPENTQYKKRMFFFIHRILMRRIVFEILVASIALFSIMNAQLIMRPNIQDTAKTMTSGGNTDRFKPDSILCIFAITASADSNGTIEPAGVTAIEWNLNQSYTITPHGGHRIDDVLVDGNSIGPVSGYTFANINMNHTIHATFKVEAYSITAVAGPNGTITPSGVTSVGYLGSQSYTITPSAGYHIADVLIDGLSIGVVSTYDFVNITTSHIISATFAIDTFIISSTAGSHGIITPEGITIVEYNTNQKYLIVPDIGYRILNVLLDGQSIGAVSEYTFLNVVANHTISASFELDAYTISTIPALHGTISPPGITAVSKGGSQNYTMIPDVGYHIANVLIDGNSIGPMLNYEFTNVSANHTISASFSVDTFVISASAGAHGSILPGGTTIVNYGADQLFHIRPDTGYHVLELKVDSSSIEFEELFYLFTHVTANHTISVTFDQDPPPMTVKADSGWVLVSVPRRQLNDSASIIFKKKFGDMFEYDQSIDKYTLIERLKCGKGYWVYYLKPTDVVFGGYEPPTYKVKSKAGWVLIGSKSNPIEISSLQLDNGASIFGNKYLYNSYTGRYEETFVINPGKAVWIFVTKECTITIP